MSMTRSEFNMAFSTVIEEEFANIPDESEIESSSATNSTGRCRSLSTA